MPPTQPTGSILRNRSVTGIGLGSFFSDAGHEMATAALPGFPRSLGAPAVALGIIEGVADSALSLSKLAGGVVADRPGVQRRSLTAGGYAVTALGHGAFALATVWPVVLVARALSWAARGGKAPARDALLAGGVHPSQLGRAFGVERAMDSLGAVLGPLLAAPLLVAIGYRPLFAVSIVPGLLAAGAVLLLVLEVPRGVARAGGGKRWALPDLGTSSPAFLRLLAGIGLFGLGNFSATLLLLRVTDLLASGGRSLTAAAAIAVLLYAGHNAANSVAAYPAGALSDRVGRRRLLAGGIVLFALGCLLFAAGPTSVVVLGVLFALVGVSTGIVEPVQAAYVADLVPDAQRGRAFGSIGLIVGLGGLVSSIGVGALWTVTDPAVGLVVAAAVSLAAAMVIVTGRPTGPR
ncbi:MAG: MFS transporter [Candidatus Dormibacteria bacterium]